MRRQKCGRICMSMHTLGDMRALDSGGLIRVRLIPTPLVREDRSFERHNELVEASESLRRTLDAEPD